jgi:cyanophycinase
MYKNLIILFLFHFLVFESSGQGATKQLTTGPDKGSLVIAGGGKLGIEIISKFIALAGGPEAKIVFIPTAGGRSSYGKDYRGADIFRDAGATNVTILHTSNRDEADDPEFTRPLLTADAVWFSGGRQWRLVDAYKDTKTEELLWEILIVVGLSAAHQPERQYRVPSWPEVILKTIRS